MLTRRRFLGYSIAGALSAASGCRPSQFDWSANQEVTSASNHSFIDEKAELIHRKNYFLGYPVNLNTPPKAFFEWRNQIRKAGVGDFAYNNVGNPFSESSIPFNTHEFEREVIKVFGGLYKFPANDTWGFLTNSGTDSNMHGMYIGRTLLKGNTGEIPKCYFTREAHYSIQILSDLLGLESIYVDTMPDAGMDPEDLRQKLTENSNYPALVVATIGTTFKGAIDNVDHIRDVLTGYQSYVHLDAALFGGYLPHTLGAGQVQYKSNNNSSISRYESIAVSCHKFFGFPAPAGLFISAQSVFDKFNTFYSRIHNPEYIGHVPGTITCSRDSVKPAEFYFFSSDSMFDTQKKDAHSVLENTAYLLDNMHHHLPIFSANRVNNLSNTIYFRKPGDTIVKKYTLATMHLNINGERKPYAHVVVMPHVSRNILDEFLSDLEKDKFVMHG